MTLPSTETANRQRQGDIGYFSLWVSDVERAAKFFGAVLGWSYAAAGPGNTLQVEGLAVPQGISELRGTGDFLRHLGVPLPQDLSPTGYAAYLVDDINSAVERVRAAGGWAATPLRQPYGTVAACIDDQGLPFSLTEVPPTTPAPRPPASGNRQGDIAYVVFEAPDAERARAFLGSVLGLQFSPGRTPNAWNIADVSPMAGLLGGSPRPRLVPMYRVDDIQAAVERVRAAGGTATDPMVEPYGTRAECVDDQGMRFLLGQL